MSISVIVATYNRCALLDECLTHLAAQRYEPGDEVVVVDNGSTDRTTAVIARHHTSFPVPLTRLHESRPGKSRALSSALAVAGADIFAFTDDDVNVDAGWLDAIRRAMADPTIALVGGRVDPRWEQPAPRWLRLQGEGFGLLGAPLALVDYGSEPSPLGERTALGANMAVRRDVITKVGGFAAHLGKLRGTLLSGEDHDLCRRVSAAGFRSVYWPGARVRHLVPASRTKLGYFLNWFYWSGITNATLDEQQPRHARSLLGLPLYLVRRFLTSVVAAPAAAATGDTAGAATHLVNAAFAAGYAAKTWHMVTL